MKHSITALALATAALATGVVNAHHSANAAFTTKLIEVEGTVTEFNFTNPHIDVFFDVAGEDGEVTEWRASGSAANLMRRRGWTAQTIQKRASTCGSAENPNGVPWCCWAIFPNWTPN